jgi:hypothetical protein
MAIAPTCNGCGREFSQLGGLFFGAQRVNGRRPKLHLCVDHTCFTALRDSLPYAGSETACADCGRPTRGTPGGLLVTPPDDAGDVEVSALDEHCAEQLLGRLRRR